MLVVRTVLRFVVIGIVTLILLSRNGTCGCSLDGPCVLAATWHLALVGLAVGLCYYVQGRN